MGPFSDRATIKDILLKESYISDDDAKAALANSSTGPEFIDYLIRQEILSKSLIGQAIAESQKLSYVDLEEMPPTKNDKIGIPEDLAKSSRLVYVKSNDHAVMIATDEPSKVDKKAILKHFKDRKVILAYTLPEYIERSFSSYEQPLETRFSSIIESGKRVAPEIVYEIIKDALTFRASDVHLEPQTDHVIVRFRIDGNLREAGQLPLENYENILNRIKVESGMRIDEHFMAQDGSFQHHDNTVSADLRVSLVPTITGEKIVMRVLGSYVQDFNLTDLGLNEKHREQFQIAAAKPFGMILNTGPTGSGKTTSLYALLKLLNKPNANITTIEDPVEYRLEGINQIQVRASAGLTFSNGLRAIVRQDPDIILVGEIRDQETAEISVNAALTGHLLLSTFHANDAATAIPRLIDMGIEPFLLASTLEIIIAQRLVRKNCSHCRTGISFEEATTHIPASSVKLLHGLFKKGDTLYRGKGCTLCGNTGYQGRSALFEIISITPQMKELIVKSPTAGAIAELAREQHDTSMFDDAIEKIKSGVTTLEEVLRVVEPPAPHKKK